MSFVWLVAAAALFCIPELGTIRGHERESESERPQGTQSRVTRSNQEVRSSSLQVPKGRQAGLSKLRAEDIWGRDFRSENSPFSFGSDRLYSELALFNLYKALNSQGCSETRNAQ